jgi:demethylmenaquinone methyltransferase / 2-methoxy-6-polyprenyl-1,4-benzoquinol methylase
MSSEIVVDKSGEKVCRMFAQIAPRYDRLNQLLSLNIDKSWRRKVVDELKLSGSSPFLDVCTGTGELAFEVARRYPGKFEVLGTDFCAPMLELARQKSIKAQGSSSSVRFLEADTERLPFDDDAFQAVAVAFGIRNVSNTATGLREMIRVCQPQGQVAVLEFSHPTLPVLKQLYNGYFRFILPGIGQLMAKNSESAYHYLPQSVREFPSGPAMIEFMKQQGLRSVRAIPLTFGVASIYLGEK